jgi:nucleoid DNA-binding protein
VGVGAEGRDERQLRSSRCRPDFSGTVDDGGASGECRAVGEAQAKDRGDEVTGHLAVATGPWSCWDCRRGCVGGRLPSHFRMPKCGRGSRAKVGPGGADQQSISRSTEATDLSRKQVAAVFDELNQIIAHNLGKKGPGVFALPGLAKLKVVRKPATLARKGINPFTKQQQMFKAKPARNVVMVVPFKALKDMGK